MAAAATSARAAAARDAAPPRGGGGRAPATPRRRSAQLLPLLAPRPGGGRGLGDVCRPPLALRPHAAPRQRLGGRPRRHAGERRSDVAVCAWVGAAPQGELRKILSEVGPSGRPGAAQSQWRGSFLVPRADSGNSRSTSSRNSAPVVPTLLQLPARKSLCVTERHARATPPLVLTPCNRIKPTEGVEPQSFPRLWALSPLCQPVCRSSLDQQLNA